MDKDLNFYAVKIPFGNRSVEEFRNICYELSHTMEIDCSKEYIFFIPTKMENEASIRCISPTADGTLEDNEPLTMNIFVSKKDDVDGFQEIIKALGEVLDSTINFELHVTSARGQDITCPKPRHASPQELDIIANRMVNVEKILQQK